MKSWYNEALDNSLRMFTSGQYQKLLISDDAIDNVPLIHYPGFTEAECLEVQSQIQDVLSTSKNTHDCKEVAITYDRTASSNEKQYHKVFGDYHAVPFMSEENTAQLIKTASENNRMVIISIHNHPNSSTFSINDLLVFTELKGIQLMNVVGVDGRVTFLMKPYEIDLSQTVGRNIIKVNTDFIKNKESWEENNPGRNIKFSELLTVEEASKIVSLIILELKEKGIYYSNYIDKDQASRLIFTQPTTLIQNTVHNTHKIQDNNTQPITLSDLGMGEYLGNGEDGYEWEF